MGRRRILHIQRHNILLLYIRGYPYREIARQALVSIGTVSNVLADLRADDNVLPLSRVLAVELRKNGQDLADYAEIIRTRAYHKRCGIDEPISQKIATEVVETCFKLHILVEQFVKSVEAFNEFSKKYAKDNPKQAIEYANTLTSYIDNLHEVIRKLRQKEVDIKTRCDNAVMNFQYLAKNPGIKNVLLDKDRQIDDLRRQRNEFKKENDALKEELEAKPNKRSEVKVIHPNQKIIELFPLGLQELTSRSW